VWLNGGRLNAGVHSYDDVPDGGDRPEMDAIGR
jgi:hypothetical protein